MGKKDGKRERAGDDVISLEEEKDPVLLEAIPKPKRLKVTVALPAHMMEKKQRPLPKSSSSSSHGGASVQVLVTDVKTLKEGAKLMAIILEEVTVPFLVTKKEREYLEKTKGASFDFKAYEEHHEPLLFQAGLSIDILMNKMSSEVKAGSYGLCANAKVGINLYKEKPQLAFHCQFELLDNPTLEKTLTLLKAVRPPTMEMLREWQAARLAINGPLPQADGYSGYGQEEATKEVVPLDTTTLSLRTVYLSSLWTCTAVFVIDNPIMGEQFVGYDETCSLAGQENTPVLYYRIPTDTVKGNYLKAPAMPRGQTRTEQPKESDLVIPCIRENNSDLRGDTVNASMELIVKTPLYMASNWYYGFDPTQWWTLAAQLWRSTRAFLFLSIDPEASLALHGEVALLYERILAPMKGAYTGFPRLQVDYLTTLSHAGLEVSWSYALSWFERNLAKNKKTTKGTEWRLEKDLEVCKKSPVSKAFNDPEEAPVRLADLPVLFLNDVRVNVVEELGQDAGTSWRCFMVPPNYLYGPTTDENPAAKILKEQAYFTKNTGTTEALTSNASYIENTWTAVETIAKNVGVFLVRRSFTAMST